MPLLAEITSVSGLRWISDSLFASFSPCSLSIWRLDEHRLKRMAQLPTGDETMLEWSSDADAFAVIERRRVAIWNIVKEGGAELAAVGAGSDRLVQLIGVYRALGGGWVDEADTLTSSDGKARPG